MFKFSRDEVEVFTCGDCFLLAYHMYASFEHPVVIFHEEGSVEEWFHVANILADGRIVDIEGIHNPSDMVKRWGGTYYGGQNAVEFLKGIVYEQAPCFPEYNAREYAEILNDELAKK